MPKPLHANLHTHHLPESPNFETWRSLIGVGMMSSSSPAGEEVNLTAIVNKIRLNYGVNVQLSAQLGETQNGKENVCCLVLATI